jgi:hypothetical protein
MIKYKSLVASLVFAMAVHVAAAGQLQPFNVQTQLGADQVALTEAQGDLNVVFCVLDGSAKLSITDSTGQQYKEKGRFGNLVAFVGQNVKAGYHLIKATGVSKMVASEYKGFTWAGGYGGGTSDSWTTGGYAYSIAVGCSNGELIVWAQVVNTPDTWIAPSPNTEVYDQMGVFAVKDLLVTDKPNRSLRQPTQYLNEVLLTKGRILKPHTFTWC